MNRATIILSLVMAIVSCNTPNKDSGFPLEEFAIDDARLKSIVDSMTEMHLPMLQPDDNEQVLSLNLTKKDSTTLFIFSLRKKDEIINRYIYRENKRILGYTNSKNEEVILLSDIDDLDELGLLFGRFIHPTGTCKSFSYMKYPSNLYIGEEQNSWPNFELIYDPTYIIYPYLNNRFLQPYMTKNPAVAPDSLLAHTESKTFSHDTIISIDFLKKKFPGFSFDSEYHPMSKDECLKLKWIEKKHIEDFYEFTAFTKTYKLKLNNKYYLILSGQPAGATGIGVDYKEYECYEFNNSKPILEFSSLQDSPFSVFYNREKENIGYWTLTKEHRLNSDSTYTEIEEYNIVLSVYTNKKCLFSTTIK